jgi:hypothetical protein
MEADEMLAGPMKDAVRMLVAIVAGNLIYFSVRTSLPFPFVHEPYRVDPGLVLDLVLCLAVYALVRWRWP